MNSSYGHYPSMPGSITYQQHIGPPYSYMSQQLLPPPTVPASSLATSTPFSFAQPTKFSTALPNTPSAISPAYSFSSPVPSAPYAPSAPSAPLFLPENKGSSFGFPENTSSLFSGNPTFNSDPFNTKPPNNIKHSKENEATSGKYKYSYIIATDSINDTSLTNDIDEIYNSNSYEPNMPFNILKERVKSLNDAGDKIYVIVKIKSAKHKSKRQYYIKDKYEDSTLPVVNGLTIENTAPIYTIYKNFKNILNIERNASEERLDEALNDFKNACVIKYGENCVIISYANEEETIKKKLIDFDDTLELLFDIRFKKVRLAAIPGVKDFIRQLDDTEEDNIIKAETVKTSGKSNANSKSKNYINVNKEGMINYRGIDIPHTKEGLIDVNKIEEIGKRKNPNFVIDSHERSDLDKINIVYSINLLYDESLPLNANAQSIHILGDIIPKITKLLNGKNYRFHSPN